MRRATGVWLCGQSVRNRLRSRNLRARRPLIAVPLTQRHRQTSIAWTNTRQHQIQRQWDEVRDCRSCSCPFLRQGNARIMQQDSVRQHTARHTETSLQQNNIVTLDWPARSPDM